MIKPPPPPPPPPLRPKYRQRVILHEGARPFKAALDEAVQDGWTIEQVTVNSQSNCWLAIVGKV